MESASVPGLIGLEAPRKLLYFSLGSPSPERACELALNRQDNGDAGDENHDTSDREPHTGPLIFIRSRRRR
jgi:hypothetical protein